MYCNEIGLTASWLCMFVNQPNLNHKIRETWIHKSLQKESSVQWLSVGRCSKPTDACFVQQRRIVPGLKQKYWVLPFTKICGMCMIRSHDQSVRLPSLMYRCTYRMAERAEPPANVKAFVSVRACEAASQKARFRTFRVLKVT